jgi:excisionase family DNA binding protein
MKTQSELMPKRILLTVKDLAEMMGVCKDLIYAESRKGNIPTIRIGNRYLFHPEAIEQWLRGQ